MNQLIAITPALDGARVCYRNWRSTQPPIEGFIREFSADKSLVRISGTLRPTDAGTWHRVMELRVEAVLDPAKAPPYKEPKAANLPARDEDFDSGEMFP